MLAQAHGDDPERAVRAGLTVAEATLGRLPNRRVGRIRESFIPIDVTPARRAK
jgi:hypothetical protein